ncbi:MAG: phosphoribosylglycinamide formyltransferase [Lachnospiraceae bacterium]|nr:phosphoribosylglycinamide formyltransferase [Lachnospiraceae bacterium]
MMSRTSKMRVVVLVSGGGTNLQALIDAVKQGEIPDTELVAVISNNAGAYALTRAEQAGIPGICLSPKNFETRALFNEELKRVIDSYQPDLIVLAGCLLQIPSALVEAYPNRIMNIHPALIPAFCGKSYYGLKVHEAALARGVKVSGATVHFVNAELDAGPIILQKAVEVREDDTPETLQKRIMVEAEWKLLPEAVKLAAEGRLSVDEKNHVHIVDAL